jgi:hypothetical protein
VTRKRGFDPHGQYTATNAAAAERRAARQTQAGLASLPPSNTAERTPHTAEANSGASRGREATMAEDANTYFTPLVRKIADQHGVDLNAVAGTGVGGRVTKADVESAAVAKLVDVTPTTIDMAHKYGVTDAQVLALQGSGEGGQVRNYDVVSLVAAQRQGVDITSVTGSGPNGAVRIEDVRAAHARQPTQQAAATAVVVAQSTGPYAANPLVEKARAEQPRHYEAAMGEGPKPTLFVAGDVPVYVASGADPSLLLKLPWQARHAAARASAAELAQMFETYGGPDGDLNAQLDLGGHAENAMYAQRVQNWLNGPMHDPSSMTPKSAARQQADEENYDALFGEQERHKAELARQKAEDKATREHRDAEDRARNQARHGR